MRPEQTMILVSHDASRTGAALAALRFMEWVVANRKARVICILLRSGPLAPLFEARCPTYCFFPPFYDSNGLVARVFRRTGAMNFLVMIRGARLRRIVRAAKPQSVYCNTIVTLPVARCLYRLRVPLVLHVREMESVIERFGGREAMAEWDSLARVILANSHATRENLLTRHAIDSEKVQVVYAHAAGDVRGPSGQKAAIGWKARSGERLETLVCGAGSGVWRKGLDVFVQCAIAIRRRGRTDIQFVWIGKVRSPLREQLQFDLDAAQCADAVRFVGETDDVPSLLALARVFVLPSREEPLGVVGLEAALRAVPTVCFDGAGGFPEFAAGGCGVVVPYLDVQAMGQAIMELCDDPAKAEQLGSNARRRAESMFTIETIGPQILAALDGQ